MSEKFYALIKDNHAYDIVVFAERNDEFANQIAEEKGYEKAVWCDDVAPTRYSSYDGENFIPPTNEFLVQVGVFDPSVLLPPLETEPNITE
jgi:hypothetical protein